MCIKSMCKSKSDKSLNIRVIMFRTNEQQFFTMYGSQTVWMSVIICYVLLFL